VGSGFGGPAARYDGPMKKLILLVLLGVIGLVAYKYFTEETY
jgi:predicted negative regulator of RcsB-dependent stress response